jgi:ABC-2 type transport system permease protein
VLELFQSWAPQALVETLASFSLLTHFRAITTGVIDARDVMFFATLIGVFLTATVIVVDMKKGEGA